VIVERYQADRQRSWDDFVRASKNGTFLFLRDYMDYHRDRFADHSLLVRDDGGQLVALLPAHQDGDTVVSHGGLTYGGFVSDDVMKLGTMLAVLDATLTYFHEMNVHYVVYKAVPHIYHRGPADEDRYALFSAGARWTRSGSLAVVRRAQHIPYQERRSRGIKRATKHGVTVARSSDFEGFWVMLTQLLDKAYGTRPVHTAEEIRWLSDRFPEHIKLFACYRDRTMLAGVVVYETAHVARAQYIASSDAGRALGAVDMLLDHLLTRVYDGKDYFDLGTSEADGGGINRGLLDQKEGFGARSIGLDQYGIDLTGWKPGQLVQALT
jgi:Acetyltransferase (GNAT) domain